MVNSPGVMAWTVVALLKYPIGGRPAGKNGIEVRWRKVHAPGLPLDHVWLEIPASVDHGQNLDILIPDLVDDAVREKR